MAKLFYANLNILSSKDKTSNIFENESVKGSLFPIITNKYESTENTKESEPNTKDKQQLCNIPEPLMRFGAANRQEFK